MREDIPSSRGSNSADTRSTLEGSRLASRDSCRVMAFTTIAVLTLAACAGSGLNEKLPKFELPANDPSFKSRIYAGVGIGNSNLKPDTSETVFTVEDGGDSASNLRLGVDVHNTFALELESAVLGAAELREAPADVSFSTLSVSALAYGLNGVQLRSRREGWSAYGRFGLTQTSKSSQVLTLDQGGTTPHIGVGIEYGFPGGLGIRGELTRYSDEAQLFGLGAIYRFGTGPRELGRLIAESTTPSDENGSSSQGPTQLATVVPADRFGNERPPETARLAAALPAGGATASRSQRTALRSNRGPDLDLDGVGDAHDVCPATARGVAVDGYGCGLFDAVLGDVVFKPGSERLTARARGALDNVASKLLAFPEVRIEVRAHTDSNGAADENLALSARRAEAVIEYFKAQGIGELQLRGRGMGEAHPLASNNTPEGRRRNRRVELVTLASLHPSVLSAGQFPSNEWLAPTVTEITDIEDDLIDEHGSHGQSAPKVAVDRSSVKQEPTGLVDPVVASVDTDAEPETGAAIASSDQDRLPPLDGLKPSALPAPVYLAGFELTGVVDGLVFERGSDELSASATDAVERIRVELERHPSAHIAIMAHTDNVGDRESNQTLSERRAQRVVDTLIASGIEQERLTAEGYGETLPLVQNVTESDRARNRRIEVRVIKAVAE